MSSLLYNFGQVICLLQFSILHTKYVKSVARQQIVSKDNPIFELLFKSGEKNGLKLFHQQMTTCYMYTLLGIKSMLRYSIQSQLPSRAYLLERVNMLKS